MSQASFLYVARCYVGLRRYFTSPGNVNLDGPENFQERPNSNFFVLRLLSTTGSFIDLLATLSKNSTHARGGGANVVRIQH